MDNQNRKLELLGNAPIPKALLAMGIPTMIGMLINALYNLVDAYFVGGLGEFVAVIGTSGSGKSTLLNMIGGLDRPTSGSVTIRGKELLKMKDEELTIFRRRNIGFVFQNYNLLPVLNVYENIVYPIEIDGGKTDTRFVKEIIHTLGLEQKLKNMPNNLSGGQQQRVAIARALATKPAIILADVN